MAKFLVIPVIIILGFASIFYVTSVKAKGDEAKKEIREKQRSSADITKQTFVLKIKDTEKSHNENENDKENNAQCFNLVGEGVKIKIAADYFINAANSGMAANDVELSVNAGAKVWETAAVNPNIFGASGQDTSAVVNDSAMDGRSVITFAPITDANIVAVTNVWGRFKVAQDKREILEFDITLNTASKWGDGSVDREVMDLQSVAANAFGHAAGLDGVSGKNCKSETTYRLINLGEIQKRDLAPGDIKGIQQLYK